MTFPNFKWKKRKLKHWFSYETIYLIQQKRQLYLHIQLPTPPLHQCYESITPYLILRIIVS